MKLFFMPPLPNRPSAFTITDAEGWYDYVIGDHAEDEWAIWLLTDNTTEVFGAYEGYYGDAVARQRDNFISILNSFDETVRILKCPDIEIVSDKEWGEEEEETVRYSFGNAITMTTARDVDISTLQAGDIIRDHGSRMFTYAGRDKSLLPPGSYFTYNGESSRRWDAFTV